MNPVLLATMHRQAGVFTVDQAEAAGVSRDDLRSLLRRHEIVRVRRNVYTAAALWNSDAVTRHRIEVAAALINRGWRPENAGPLVAGHRSAACLWGFRLPWGVLGHAPETAKLAVADGSHRSGPSGVELVSADRCKRTYRAGVSVRPAHMPESHVSVRNGVPVTSLARTAVDLMRETDRTNAMIIGDQALRLGCAKPELIGVAEYCSGWRGGKQAVELALLADGRAESAAESLGRLVVHDAGLRGYVPQFAVVDANGQQRRLDIAFPDRWVALEPDGKVKYDDPHGDPADVLWKEKLREDAIRDVGWEIVRATWHQLNRERPQVLARLDAAFVRAERRHAC